MKILYIYPYSELRHYENSAGFEPITQKQLQYIINLRHEDKDAILSSIPEWETCIDYDLQKLTKGQAMYVIKCLTREIQPLKITKDVAEKIARALADGFFNDCQA